MAKFFTIVFCIIGFCFSMFFFLFLLACKSFMCTHVLSVFVFLTNEWCIEFHPLYTYSSFLHPTARNRFCFKFYNLHILVIQRCALIFLYTSIFSPFLVLDFQILYILCMKHWTNKVDSFLPNSISVICGCILMRNSFFTLAVLCYHRTSFVLQNHLHLKTIVFLCFIIKRRNSFRGWEQNRFILASNVEKLVYEVLVKD